MAATLSSSSVDEIIARLGAQSTCDAGLTQDPWHFDTTQPSYGPGASMFDPLPNNAPRQQVLPQEYRDASDEELQERIKAAKARLGNKLLILGHFYQRDEIIVHADFVGDSFQLAKNATERPDADHIVFCGVHFMAETADILSTPEQTVTLPNLSAGCSMADMANIDQVEDCWEQLGEICGTNPDADGKQQIVPVTYMNSSAALKAFCGRHGGIVCTSSNAHAVLEWAFARGKRVLFFPDQHLGRNTALAMGMSLDQMPVWNPYKPAGGAEDPSVYADAKMILWKGFCSVHQRFTVDQIERARKAYPGVKVIVHPECSMDVVNAADGTGSTAYIVKEIANAPAGSAVEAALEEDAPNGDITCETTIPAEAHGTARLVSRQEGVMSGIAVFEAAFAAQNPAIRVLATIKDGERFEAGQTLAEVEGPVRDLLTAERVALNFTQRMCGIATMTAAFVKAADEAVKTTDHRTPRTYACTRIVDTRKTTPGLRPFEKYAVTCGGGHNHRYGLSDAVMVKDNHLAALAEQGIDMAGAIRHIREQVGHTTHIEVEVDRLEQIKAALEGGADTIMLDNFSLEDTRKGVDLIAGNAIVEASGNMTLERIPQVAATGVDVISVGALTHSVSSIDLGLDWN